MPAAKSNINVMELLKKQGLAKAHAAHKDDETKTMGGDLPSGIRGGIAQLVDCKIGVYQKGDNIGKPFFYAAGVVMEPAIYAGMRTQQGPEPLCDTPKSQSRPEFVDHYAWMLNELRNLGVVTAELGDADIEDALAALVQEAPFFRFGTSGGEVPTTGPYKGKPGRIWHNWYGLAKGYVPSGEVAANAVTDNSEEGKAESEDEGSGEEPGTGDGADWADLGEKADADDIKVQKQITAACKAAGLDAESYDTWSEAAAAVADAAGGSGDDNGSDTDAAEEWKPEEGLEVSIKWPKGEKKVAKFKVTKVNDDDVTLRRLSDKKVFAKVPYTSDPAQIAGQDVT